MGVNFRGRDRLMTKHILNGFKVSATLNEVRSE